MTAARYASPIVDDPDIFPAAKITASTAFRGRTPNRSCHAMSSHEPADWLQNRGLALP